MKARTKEEQDKLDAAKIRRQIEIEELAVSVLRSLAFLALCI